MIVCQCHVVSDRDLSTAVREGAVSLGEVCRRTGAGQGCGSCIFSVKQLVCQHGGSFSAVPVPTLEAARAAS